MPTRDDRSQVRRIRRAVTTLAHRNAAASLWLAYRVGQENHVYAMFYRDVVCLANAFAKQCDGGRPTCQTCSELGFDCKYTQSASSSNAIVGKEYIFLLNSILPV